MTSLGSPGEGAGSPEFADPAAEVPSYTSPHLLQPQPRLPGGWSYWDVLYLFLFSIPALILAVAVSMGVFHGVNYLMERQVPTEELSQQASLVVGIQLLWWALLLGYIYSVVTMKHGLPFGPAIGWNRLTRPASTYLLAGVLLAVSVAALSSFLPMPTEKLPIEDLLKDRFSLVLLAFFGVLIAPAIEELVFRGFLYPVVERSHGRAMAILSTSAIFSLVHAQQYGWHWQNLLLLLFVGIVFGAVRARTGSLVPCTLMHAAYNATLFAGLFAAGDQLQKM